jgi:hypothetical protein
MAHCNAQLAAVEEAEEDRKTARADYENALADGINVHHYWWEFRQAIQRLAQARSKLRQCLTSRIMRSRVIAEAENSALDVLNRGGHPKIACPFCREPIHSDADRCPHCHSVLNTMFSTPAGCGCSSEVEDPIDASTDFEGPESIGGPGSLRFAGGCFGEISRTPTGLVNVGGRLRCGWIVCYLEQGPFGCRRRCRRVYTSAIDCLTSGASLPPVAR